MKKLLCGILPALLLSFTASAQHSGAVTIDTLAKSTVSWDGKRLPGYEKGTPQVTILRFKIPPGVQLALHDHPVINAGVVMSGTLTVITEKKDTLRLKAGETFVEVVSTAHFGKNEGNTTTELIIFYAGVADKPITQKK